MWLRRCRSRGEGSDLDEVVGQDAMPGPDSGSFGAVDAGAIPAVAAFEGADAAFASIRHGDELPCGAGLLMPRRLGRLPSSGFGERWALTALELEVVGRPLGSDGFAGAVDGIQYRPWQGALLDRGEVVLEVGDG
jgi:hypothetical protein